MLKFYHILLLTLVAVFIASAASIARYAADSCTQSRMYRQLAALTENFPGDAVSTGNNFLPQYQTLYTQNSDLAGWIQIDGTNINYPVMQSKHDPDFYLKHNFEKADSPHGCPYVQANCDLQTPSDNILVYGHNMKDGTMFSDLLQYKRESFWEQHRIIQFDTLTAQAEYTVMAVFRGEAEDLFAYYQCTDAETPQEFAAYVDACKGAALYDTVNKQEDGTSVDSRVWISKSRGLPLKQTIDMDVGGKRGKSHTEVSIDYANVQAPVGVK